VREALSREFPEAVALAGRVPAVRATRPSLAGLAAIGGFFLVEQTVRALITAGALLVDRETVAQLGSTVYELGGAPAVAIGLAVARRAGDRRAVLIFLLYVATSAFIALARTVVLALSCAPLDDVCARAADPIEVLLRQWPAALGLLASFVFTPLVKRGGPGANPALEGAGAIAVGYLAVFALFAPASWLHVQAEASTIQLVVVIVQAAFGAAAGLVIAARAAGRTGPAILVAGILTLSWLALLGPRAPQLLQAPSAGWLNLFALFAPLLTAALLVAVAFAFRRPRRPIRRESGSRPPRR
jgi:hypothetical protein